MLLKEFNTDTSFHIVTFVVFVLFCAVHFSSWACLHTHTHIHYDDCVCVCVFQTDSSFLDTIYEAYVSRFANNASSKY